MVDSTAIPEPLRGDAKGSTQFRRIVLNVHMYGGLLCFGFLVLFGISVLNFNHPFALPNHP